ncbi:MULTISPECIES: hypothetical protein [Cyanophyceae]|uniref:Uncharacterized protein n=1 Tax=Nodularia spumigena CENA596 TaxID=1819295 RepID=A0A161USH8_NODSP|nr:MULTISPECIES: hypothetical protein [Cyanophyceae]MDB9357791.1 hypothetical protein [Nodularia spumigena CS-587/03]KZL48803.1 hypothetical protein A2T98_16075 [Nodularia spumigena CENA596]MDB9305303.1 hypothetical protein [Nodularia spumigena CS-591/12]MDB9320006.1 hypothetical protein [Nodularia spumigena CS-590/01A]MDB9324506.1 hypothetical protein [Nodularia spumigena CS-591/07A]
MSAQITKSDLFEELSAEQQQLLAGGEGPTFEMRPDERGFDGDGGDFGRYDRDFGRDDRRSEGRVRRIPIRLTGILEVIK